MKNTFKYFAAALTVIAAVSCAKQELTPEEGKTPAGSYDCTIQVTQEDTKTTMDGLSILWKATDQIGVGCLDADDTYKRPSESAASWSIIDEGFTSGNKATFGPSTDLPEGHTPYVVGYPYYSGMSLRTEDDGVPVEAINITIPSTQTAVKDGIPDNALVMVGKIVDGECFMRNAASVIKFTITREDIVSLTFTGNKNENISGRCYYHVESGECQAWTSFGEKSVTLVPPEGSTVFEPGDYYFVVGQQNLKNGFTITLTNAAGQQAVRKSEVPFDIKRNQKYTRFGSDEGLLSDIKTLTAGNLGSEDGTTAVIYGRTPSKDISYGFETSTDGITWTPVTSEITQRFSEDSKVYIYAANLTGLTPEEPMYFRAVCTNTNGITTYGRVETFKTYANAQSVVIDMYNGYDTDYWPFTNIFRNETTNTEENIGLNKGSGTLANWIGVDCPLTVAGDYTFTLKASSNGLWLGGTCLTFRTKKTDYLKFPVIPGKRPVSVTLMNGGLMSDDPSKLGNNTVGAPSIVKLNGMTTDDSGNEVEDVTVVTGGKAWEPKNQTWSYYSKTWSLSGTDDGQYQMYFNSSDRNCYMSYLEVVYETVSTDDSKIEQEIVFSDGTTYYWPFEGANLCGAHETLAGENVTVGPLNTSLYPDIKYEFHVASISGDVQNDWRVTAGRGIRFGKSGDYFRICPVPNYRLSEIILTEGNATIKYSIKDDEGNIVDLHENVSVAEYAKHTFTLNSTVANTGYCIVVGANPAIRALKITYERVD